MAARKPAAKAINTESDAVRSAAAKKSAPIAKATRVVVEKPGKPSIAMDAKAADVEKLIAGIKNRGAKLDNDIHSAAVACLWHTEKHGDYTLMNRLLMAMPKSTRRNALAQWAIAFGKVMENTDKNAVATSPLVFNKNGKTDLEGAQAKPFWDFKNVKEGTTEWVFSNYIEGVMKSLASQASKPTAEGAKAKAAFDALSATVEAINIRPASKLPEGVQEDRRAPAVPLNVPAAPATATAH